MQPLSITLKGVTNDQLDPGIDVLRTVTLPLLKRLGVEENGLELKVCVCVVVVVGEAYVCIPHVVPVCVLHVCVL